LALLAHISLPALAVSNGDFSAGLAGWTVEVSPITSPPGTVSAVGGAAEISEGRAHFASLQQVFAIPLGANALRFEVVAGPTWSNPAPFIPDAFEAHLTTPQGIPLVPTWRLGSSAFFSTSEPGTTKNGATTTVQGAVVKVPLLELAAGTEARLTFALVGGDTDTMGTVRVDNVVLEVDSPPSAFAGADKEFNCGAEGIPLEGIYSFDPEGLPLQYEWKDSSGAVFATTANVTLNLAPGTYVYTLTVTDARGLTSSDTVTYVVNPTTPACICEGLLGDINGSGEVNVSDVVCGIQTALWAGGEVGPPPGCLAGPPTIANLNCLGNVNVVDVQLLILLALQIPLSGNLDADADGCPDACVLIQAP
jgi:hypothetical protein